MTGEKDPESKKSGRQEGGGWEPMGTKRRLKTELAPNDLPDARLVPSELLSISVWDGQASPFNRSRQRTLGRATDCHTASPRPSFRETASPGSTQAGPVLGGDTRLPTVRSPGPPSCAPSLTPDRPVGSAANMPEEPTPLLGLSPCAARPYAPLPPSQWPLFPEACPTQPSWPQPCPHPLLSTAGLVLLLGSQSHGRPAGLTHPCLLPAGGLLLLSLSGPQGPAFLWAPLGQT